jgi:hypothetical protein
VIRPAALDAIALFLYWSSLALGVALPWALHLAVNGPGPEGALITIRRLLFAPGENLFLLGVWNAIPFTAYGVFALLHLGTADRRPAAVAVRRLGGAVGAGLAALATSAGVQLSILTSRSSTAAIGYLFLPFEVSISLVGGYVAGRLVATLWTRSRRV